MANTLYGPYIKHQGASVETRLIRVPGRCHPRLLARPGIPRRKGGILIEAYRAAFYKRGAPDSGSCQTLQLSAAMEVSSGSSKEQGLPCLNPECKLSATYATII